MPPGFPPDEFKNADGLYSFSMYDNTCRFLAEHFSADFANWLLGKPAALTEIKPSELSLEPIRAEANLMAASAVLAGIRLEEEVIYRLLRRDIMQESVIYRSIQEEAETRKQREIAINLLREGVAMNIIASATGLSMEELQQLQQQQQQ